MIAGCGADLLINIALTILGYFPGQYPHQCGYQNMHANQDFAGHIHAFYLEYVYYNRKEQAQQGYYENRQAPGVYSPNVNTGGNGYGTMGATN